MWMYHYTKYIVTDRTGLLCLFFSYFATVCGIYKRDINLAYTYIPEQDNPEKWRLFIAIKIPDEICWLLVSWEKVSMYERGKAVNPKTYAHGSRLMLLCGLWPLLLTWFNCIPSMDNKLHPL